MTESRGELFEYGSTEYIASLLYDHITSVFGSLHRYPECAEILLRWIDDESTGVAEQIRASMREDPDNSVSICRMSALNEFRDMLLHMHVMHDDEEGMVH